MTSRMLSVRTALFGGTSTGLPPYILLCTNITLVSRKGSLPASCIILISNDKQW